MTSPDPTIARVADHDGTFDPHWLDESTDKGRESHSRIPARYRGAIVDVPEVADWVRALVDHAAGQRRTVPRIDAGPSLLLIGATGTGKTHTAFGAVRALTVSGALCPWQALTAADLYARLRPRHGVDSEAEFDKVSRAGLLVLDDLGAAKGTEWNEEVNYRLVNYRYENELPTLVTSNVPPRDLGGALGERVASRLVEMATRVVLRGADRRLAGSAA